VDLKRALLNDNGLHGLHALYGLYGLYRPYGPYGLYGYRSMVTTESETL